MKSVVLGALAGAGLVWAAVGVLNHPNTVFAQPSPAYGMVNDASELIALPGPTGEKGQLLTVVDRRQRVLGVYHIDQTTGKIALRSVRNIQWDLQLTHLDNDGLLPREIQSLLETR